MRTRLIAAIAGVAAVAVLLFALPLAVVLQRSYRDDELLRLQRDTVAATRQVDLSRAGGDPIELPQSSDTLTAYDARGRRVAGSGPPTADAVTLEAIRTGKLADSRTGGQFEVAAPLLVREQVGGVLRAIRSDDAVSRDTNNARLALAGLALGIAALSVFAALILGRRLASPLERLAQSARKLGGGDFTTRTPHFDVAEADAVGEALDATAKRLGTVLARERAFSADASHQLRTPLAALRIELEAIELRGEAPPEVPRALQQVDRLQSTIETLISVARDTDRGPRTADLGNLLRQAEEHWHGPLAERGRRLRIDAGKDLVAKSSADVVAEILEVLLDNAYRHGDGGVSVIARPASNNSVAIDVEDEGQGLGGNPEAAFERRSGSGESHGIGLHLARSLAAAEGGRVVVTRAQPAPVFTIFLPAEPGPARRAEPSEG